MNNNTPELSREHEAAMTLARQVTKYAVLGEDGEFEIAHVKDGLRRHVPKPLRDAIINFGPPQPSEPPAAPVESEFKATHISEHGNKCEVLKHSHGAIVTYRLNTGMVCNAPLVDFNKTFKHIEPAAAAPVEEAPTMNETAPHERMDAIARRRFIEQCGDNTLTPIINGLRFGFQNTKGVTVGEYWTHELGSWAAQPAASPAPAAVEPEQADKHAQNLADLGLDFVHYIQERDDLAEMNEEMLAHVAFVELDKLRAAVEPPSAPVVDDRERVQFLECLTDYHWFGNTTGDVVQFQKTGTQMHRFYDRARVAKWFKVEHAPTATPEPLQVAQIELAEAYELWQSATDNGTSYLHIERLNKAYKALRALRPAPTPTPETIANKTADDIANATGLGLGPKHRAQIRALVLDSFEQLAATGRQKGEADNVS